MMRLSENDREVLACAFFQADAPASKIAEECNLGQHVVRRSLENLLESGYITRRVYLNPYRLGYQDYLFLFSSSPEHAQGAKQFVEQLKCAPEVYWLGTLGPNLTYECALVARNSAGLQAVFDRALQGIGPVQMSKEVVPTLSHTWFTPKFLSPNKHTHRFLSCSVADAPVPIDDVDHNVLTHVTKSSFVSVAQIARDMGLPPSTVSYRLERLKDIGVIAGHGFRIAGSHLVGMVPFRLRITLTRSLPECRPKIQEICDGSPGVYYLAESQGRFDVSIGCRVTHPREIATVTESLRHHLGDMVGSIESVTDDGIIKHPTYAFSRS